MRSHGYHATLKCPLLPDKHEQKTGYRGSGFVWWLQRANERRVMAKSWPCFSFFFVPALVLSILLASSASGRFVHEAKRKIFPTHSTRDDETGKRCTKSDCLFAVNASETAKFRNLIFNENALAVLSLLPLGTPHTWLSKTWKTIKKRKKEYVVKYTSIIQKWAWLRNKRGRFLATLPYDFDILSLTTLKRDAFSVDLSITTTPVNCFANLSQNCLYSSIARTIVEDLTGPLGNICVRTVKGGGYRCCEHGNNSVFSCDISIENNQMGWNCTQISLGLVNWIWSLCTSVIQVSTQRV